jgi:uncharacterized protein (TIGR03066 family)
MRLFRFPVTSCLVIALVGCNAAYKDKIIGTWEVVEPDGSRATTIVEFTKDGKMITKDADKTKTGTEEATYVVEGDKLKATMKENGKELTQTATINKLTDKELVTTQEDGTVVTLQRK